MFVLESCYDKTTCYPSIGSATVIPSIMNTSRDELAKFLRARRAALQPEMFGFSSGKRRRTPGLRREEVASLALVGVTWYTWLEQGRDIRVSAGVLDRTAKALRLSPSDTTYLFVLAGYVRPETDASTSQVDARLQQIIDGFTAGPAMISNGRFDCVAFNHLADIIYQWDAYKGPFARNFLWRSFMDP